MMDMNYGILVTASRRSARGAPPALDADEDGRRPRTRERVSTLALVLVLLAYANGSAWLATRRPGDLTIGLSRAHLVMLGIMLLWAWADGLQPRELGLSRAGLRRGAATGALVGVLGSVPMRGFFRLPVIARWPIDIGEYRHLTGRQIGWVLGGQFLIGSALFEEVAFRGLLQAKLQRLFGTRGAVLACSAVFAGWHAIIAWHNVRRCNVAVGWFAPIYGGVLGVLFCAGCLFSLVRQGTGHVAASVMTHWVVVVDLAYEVMRLAGLGPGGSPADGDWAE